MFRKFFRNYTFLNKRYYYFFTCYYYEIIVCKEFTKNSRN